MASFTEEVRSALQKVLPRMVSDSGGAELETVHELSRGIQVKLVGSCTCCSSQIRSAAALARDLLAGCPSLQKIEVIVVKNGIITPLILKERSEEIPTATA